MGPAPGGLEENGGDRRGRSPLAHLEPAPTRRDGLCHRRFVAANERVELCALGSIIDEANRSGIRGGQPSLGVMSIANRRRDSDPADRLRCVAVQPCKLARQLMPTRPRQEMMLL